MSIETHFDECEDQLLNAKHPSDYGLSSTERLRQTQLKQRKLAIEEQKPLQFPKFGAILRQAGRCLFLSDINALLISYYFGAFIAAVISSRYHHDDFKNLYLNNVNNMQELTVYFGLGLVALLWLDTKGHYRQRLPYWENLSHITSVALLGLIGAGFIQYALKDSFSRLQIGFSWIIFGCLMVLLRSFVRRLLVWNKEWIIPSLVMGNNITAKNLSITLRNEREMGYSVVSFIASEHLRSLYKVTAWKQALMLHEAEHVFIALEGSEVENHQDAIKALVRARIPYSIIPPHLGLPSSSLSTHHFIMNDLVILQNTNRLTLPLPRFLKRSFDLLCASAALVFLSPLMGATALLVKQDGGPALFKQTRVGLNGKLFQCYKFRSMRVDAEHHLQYFLDHNPDALREWNLFQKLKTDVRVTSLGHFIRKTSLDELPQLLNVVRGEMSLVGPRPIMPDQEEIYAEDLSYYQSVRPGITGPWQVSGRSTLTFKERVNLEAWYARNWSLWLDIVIILKTFPTLFKKNYAV